MSRLFNYINVFQCCYPLFILNRLNTQNSIKKYAQGIQIKIINVQYLRYKVVITQCNSILTKFDELENDFKNKGEI